MKKVIAAAAGLMLAGAMVGTAAAEVSFGGDARARALFQENYDFGATEPVVDEDGNTIGTQRVNENENKVTSRVRVQARGEAPGGAYAVARFRAGNSTWGTDGMTSVDADKAYIGVPMGMTLLEAGRLQYDLLKNTKFFEQDISKDGAELFIMPNDQATIALVYFIDEEGFGQEGLNSNDDIVDYGIWAEAKFAGDWMTRLGVLYTDNQQTDNEDDDGAYGGIEFAGPAGPLAISGALAGDDRTAEDVDTGYGGFLQGAMTFGATTAALNVGFVNEGFTADGDFGFIMLGGGTAITPYTVGEQGTDTWWIGAPVTFAVSEALTLRGVLAYIDMDTFGDGFEISGGAKYLISDGANLEFLIGYIGYSEGDTGPAEGENPFGAGLTFNVSF